MNNKKAKIIVMGYVQALVIILLWFASSVDLFLRRCLAKLGYAGSQPKPGYLTHERPTQELSNTAATQYRQELFAAFILECSEHDDNWVDWFRASIEDLPLARQAVCYSRELDPHLYAVLKPTRKENLKRIESIVTQLTTDNLLFLLEDA